MREGHLLAWHTAGRNAGARGAIPTIGAGIVVVIIVIVAVAGGGGGAWDIL